MSEIKPVAWVERTEEGYTRMWSSSLEAWSERPANPEPLYDKASIDVLSSEILAYKRASEILAIERAEFRIRAERAESDSARIDWIEDNGCQQFLGPDNLSQNHEKRWFDTDSMGSDYCENFRSAIDAAMKEQEQGK